MVARPIILGVPDRVDAHVLATAAELAAKLRTTLLCIHVDATRYQLEELDDGSVRSAPLNPDSGEESLQDFPAELLQQIRAQLAGLDLHWQTQARAGGAGAQLAQLAVAHDAALIVLGVRQRSVANRIREVLNGSVALHLAHRQCYPVLLVPPPASPRAE